jgi:mRNA-degrading endonuclease toxin of MazEF toxin-antitoxin module
MPAKPRRGDVVLLPFPFADLTSTKVRPALVLSSSLYHKSEPDIIVAAITSNVPLTKDLQITPSKTGGGRDC